jgi:histidinol-phosphate/aromatic aminotransferase/cobyric acid decarboxylase-like protein
MTLSAWHAARNAAVAAAHADRVTRFGLRPLAVDDAELPPVVRRLGGGAVWAWQPGTAPADRANLRVGIAGHRLHLGHLSLARDVARFQEGGFPVTFVGRPGRNPDAVRTLIDRIRQFGGDEPTRILDLDTTDARAFEDRVLASLTLGRVRQVYGWTGTTPLTLLQDAATMMSFFLYDSDGEQAVALVDAGQAPHTALLRTVARRLAVPAPHVAYRRLLPGLRGAAERASVRRPDSTIFLDEPASVARERFTTAVTGGRASAEEQRALGGDPTACPAFEVIELLCEPGRAAAAAERCRAGAVLCRGCKTEHAEEVVSAITRCPLRAGTSTTVPAVLRTAARTLYRPPPPNPTELEAEIAEYAGVEPAQVVVGNGSTEILDWIMREQAHPRSAVLATAPTFELYQQLSDRHGLRYDTVSWIGHSHDLDRLAANLTGEHVAVVTDIPHTVSGTSVPLADLLASVARRLGSGAKLVIDNVYGEYMAQPVGVTPQLLEERGELVVCRSLSKAHCLLGARVGYALTSAAYAARLRQHQLPYGVSSLASAAAHAALTDNARLRRNVAANRQAYVTLTGELDRLGIRYVPSDANFLLIDLGKRHEQVLANLRACGLRFREGARWQLTAMIQVHLIDEATVAPLVRALRALR